MAGRGYLLENLTISTRRHSNNRRGKTTLSSVARETTASLAADSPVLAMFRNAATILNNRQDRHERLVKLSRDITIESKRIIFLLHSALKKEDQDKVVEEAIERLNKLIKGPIKNVGLELENSPAHLHSRAVTAGFQEFIEAYTLCFLIKKREIINRSDIQKEFQYQIKTKVEDEEVERVVETFLPQTDYMLGLADLTGELMRRSINSISSGDSHECVFVCQIVRDLYTGFLGLFGVGKEFTRKLSTSRANVTKVENAVYALKVRGGETVPALLVSSNNWETPTHLSDDEGFY